MKKIDMTKTVLPTIAVVGGSIGGLCAGVALRAAGYDVDIFERRAEALSSRGAGIVVQPELRQLIEGIGGSSLATTSCSHRRTMDADGNSLDFQNMAQRFTSWEAIHRALLSLFPIEQFHLNTGVQGFQEEADQVRLDFGDNCTNAYGALILADGARSRMREQLNIDVTRAYAGYVAWRGTVAESDLPDSLVRFFEDAFVFCEGRDGSHALCYFIPGDGGSLDVGTRRLNWVWYENVPEGEQLDTALTDSAGRQREGSLPPGAMGTVSSNALRKRASRVLESHLAAVIEATSEPFLQAIEDQAAQHMVQGRTALLGDAASVIRPHTAAAAAKAAGDAMALADALRLTPYDIDTALQAYQHQRLPVAHSLTRYGIALGHRAMTLPK